MNGMESFEDYRGHEVTGIDNWGTEFHVRTKGIIPEFGSLDHGRLSYCIRSDHVTLSRDVSIACQFKVHHISSSRTVGIHPRGWVRTNRIFNKAIRFTADQNSNRILTRQIVNKECTAPRTSRFVDDSPSIYNSFRGNNFPTSAPNAVDFAVFRNVVVSCS